MRAWPPLLPYLALPLLAGGITPLVAQETSPVTELAPIEVTTPRIAAKSRDGPSLPSSPMSQAKIRPPSVSTQYKIVPSGEIAGPLVR